MPDSQTVEDLGKLVKSKYPKTYDSLSDVELGQKVKGKYPDAYGSFSDMPASAMSRFGTGVYNTTVGPVINTAKGLIDNPLETLSHMTGAHQIAEAVNQFKQGHYGPAALAGVGAASPAARMATGTVEPITKDVQQGNYAGAAGQASGLGLSMLAPKALSAVGDTKLASAAGAGVKAAAPDVVMGGAMAGAGAGLSHVPVIGSAARYGMTYPGIGMVTEGLRKGSQAFGEAWKGPKVEPPSPPPIPTKGPSIGDLKTAVSKGTMTPEAFDASIDKMSDLTPEAKNLHKANVRASQTTPVKFPVTSPKTLNLGQLQKSVGSGRMSIDDFTGEVKKLGYTEEHANELTEQLKDSLKEEKEAEEAKKAKSTSEPKEKPKNQTKAPEVKTEAPKVKPLEVKPELEVEPKAREFQGKVSSPEERSQFQSKLDKLNEESSGRMNDAIREHMASESPQDWFEKHAPGSGIKSEHIPEVRRAFYDYQNLKQARAEFLKNNPSPTYKISDWPQDVQAKFNELADLEQAVRERYRSIFNKYATPTEDIKEFTVQDAGGTKIVDNPNYKSKDIIPRPKQGAIGEVEPPKSRRSPDRPYEDPDNPLQRGPINEAQIEEAQSIDRAAKETTLARHLIKNKIDLDSIPKTSEYLKAISQEAGLKRVASLQTLEGAIRRARRAKELK